MVRIKDKTLSIPLIQGGMGVGISLGNLAGHVAKCGGMGVISAAHSGYRDPDFAKNPIQMNFKSLKEEIQKAKEIAQGNGLVAVNVMVAANYYPELIKCCIDGGADAIISGAGLPIELPGAAKGSDVLLAPIVSSAKAARVIFRHWSKKHNRLPDFLVIEGSEAGGHLGFDKDELLTNTTQSLEEILAEVLEVIKGYEENIPVFVAGGVYTGYEMAEYIKNGATGVQIATRFIGTHECDASTEFKQTLIDAKKEDIIIIKSPVGMPGRALRTPLIEKMEQGIRVLPKHCVNCLRPCDPATTPYCITEALIEAVKGNYEEGLYFCGSNAYRLDKLYYVSEVIDQIVREWRETSV